MGDYRHDPPERHCCLSCIDTKSMYMEHWPAPTQFAKDMCMPYPYYQYGVGNVVELESRLGRANRAKKKSLTKKLG